MSIDTSTRLTLLGESLERAASADLERDGSRAGAGGSRRSRSRRLAVALAALVVAVPAGAVAADQLFSAGDVAASLPAGTQALIGTNPTCTVVQAAVEYHCTLAAAPSSDGGPAPGEWQGTVEPTVDASKHVNGGCRALDAAGTSWECYIGQEAVRQAIVSQSFLGTYAPAPGVG